MVLWDRGTAVCVSAMQSLSPPVSRTLSHSEILTCKKLMSRENRNEIGSASIFIKRAARSAIILIAFVGVMLLMLKSVYSYAFFQNVSQELKARGWASAEEDSVIRPHEEAVYEASYLFFKIGAASFHLLGKTVYNGMPAYRIVARINSYSGIPFVDYHAVYETYADARTLTCLYTFNRQRQGDGWLHTDYRFDFTRRLIDWSQSKDGILIRQDTLSLNRDYTDGLSFYYFVREACQKANGKQTKLRIPIVSDTVLSTVDLTLNEKREACKVPACEYPVDSYKMSGHINFTGTFGVTGDFTGWVSTDSAEVPLKGDLKVILGSIVVKLKEFRGRDWVPPRSE